MMGIKISDGAANVGCAVSTKGEEERRKLY
jgi:hypothetical protein